jgi:uncharacterized protein YggE
MNKRYTLLAGLLIVAMLSIALVACNTPQAEPQAASATVSQETARYITVVGLGKASLTPDVAQINVGTEISANTVSEAKAEVDRHIEAILAVLREMGVADKDIQTSQYSIYYEREPFYAVEREPGQEAQGAYRVSNMLNVTVRDMTQIGEILDAVVEAGANQMYGVTFTVSDTQKWESEAREKAMTDAQARAGELARLAGVELGEVLSVSEVVGGSPSPMAFAVVERAAGGGGISPGELEFSTQIQVTFAIR